MIMVIATSRTFGTYHSAFTPLCQKHFDTALGWACLSFATAPHPNRR
jgi:hypothetical protein